MNTNIHVWSLLTQFLLEWKTFETNIVEKNQNRLCVLNNFFLIIKSYNLWDNVEKYCRAEQATDDNMTHAHCMLDA
jgi:hypothetical protein